MKNLFNLHEVRDLDDLGLRVYTSRLLGSEEDLVLHGGGNTSVKIGDLLYVKGSGWDLATIEKEGFSPTRMEPLLELLRFDRLSDSDMVRCQKEALTDKNAPNPSIEAILHALIPYKFVDHTHADAIVTISNTLEGKRYIEEIFGDSYLIVPYIMPGFELAKAIYELTKEIDWKRLDGIILLHHGVFTFDDDAKISYGKMIATVSRAEDYLDRHAALHIPTDIKIEPFELDGLEELLIRAKGCEVVLRIDQSPLARTFATQSDSALYQKGILTPEHIIRTKRFPAVFDSNYQEELASYIKNYEAYFARNAKDEIMLNPAPNWAVIRGVGTLAIGKNEKEAAIIEDIVSHTIKAILQGEKLGGYQSIGEAECFAMEYWELEQMKLRGK